MLEWKDDSINGGSPITHYEVWYKENTDVNYVELDPTVVKKSTRYPITALVNGG